jgi:hypothetical protein
MTKLHFNVNLQEVSNRTNEKCRLKWDQLYDSLFFFLSFIFSSILNPRRYHDLILIFFYISVLSFLSFFDKFLFVELRERISKKLKKKELTKTNSRKPLLPPKRTKLPASTSISNSSFLRLQSKKKSSS